MLETTIPAKSTNEKLAPQVRRLERRNAELEELCGEMLATLRMNIDRRGLLAASAEGQADLEDLLRNWNARYGQARAEQPQPTRPDAPFLPQTQTQAMPGNNRIPTENRHA